jgi:hypothetical protein
MSDEFSPECDCPPRGGGACLAHAAEQLWVEVKRRGAAIERVRALHVKSDDGPYCSTCGPAYHTICCDEPAWPCPTIEALDGEGRG